MKIQYLKSTHDSATGDIKEVNSAQADVLIKLGFVKPYKTPETKPDSKPRKTKKES